MDRLINRICAEFLENCQQRGLTRSLKTVQGPQGRTVRVEGAEYVSFASNDYLGLAGNPTVIAAAREALNEYGLGTGSSRLIVGNMQIHNELEEAIARFKGREVALLYPTGYMANIGLIPRMACKGDVIFSDASNHSSLIDGIRLSRAECIIYRHLDMADLEDKLRTAKCQGNRFIITDSLFSMEGDLAPLPDIVRMAEKYNAVTMIDDAHATGTLGERGRGAEEHFGITGSIDIVMGTFSKAFGALGGFVTGSSVLREFQVNSARSFIYTTGLPPVVASGALAAVRMLEEDPSPVLKLRANIQLLHAGLRDAGIDVPSVESPIVLVKVGKEHDSIELGKHFLEHGMIVPPVRYPTVPEGAAALRISVTAAHTTEDLSTLVKELARTLEKHETGA